MGDRTTQPNDQGLYGYEIVARSLHYDGIGALRSGDVVASAVSGAPTLGEAVDELRRAVSAVSGPAGDVERLTVGPDGGGPLAPTIRTLLGHQQRTSAALSELASITAAMATEMAKLDGQSPSEHPASEMVWLGDLSGYQVDTDDHGEPMLSHRCGWGYQINHPTRAYLANLLPGPVADHRRAGCATDGTEAGRAQEPDVDVLVANVARSLASATNDDERAEAIEMLLSGWYGAWPDEALTSPDAPLAAELVRLLGHRAPVGIQGPTDQEVPTGPYSGPCETCGKPLYTHVCPSCSPDRRTPGRGCINCRNTGMDQTPCLPPSG